MKLAVVQSKTEKNEIRDTSQDSINRVVRARSEEEEVEAEGTNVKLVVKVKLTETAGEWKNR